jgi:hypothetical protein
MLLYFESIVTALLNSDAAVDARLQQDRPETRDIDAPELSPTAAEAVMSPATEVPPPRWQPRTMQEWLT